MLPSNTRCVEFQSSAHRRFKYILILTSFHLAKFFAVLDKMRLNLFPVTNGPGLTPEALMKKILFLISKIFLFFLKVKLRFSWFSFHLSELYCSVKWTF